MEKSKKENAVYADKEIVFSKAIKAGKRIYYLDVKKNRKGEMFLAITESKKVVSGEEDLQVSFEKHKIFLYKEDFEKFIRGLGEVMDFMAHQQSASGAQSLVADADNLGKDAALRDEIKLDIDFE